MMASEFGHFNDEALSFGDANLPAPTRQRAYGVPSPMKTCEYAGPAIEARSHPWVDSATLPDCRYYDLKAAPERIRDSLEDFLPWRRHRAIQDFYALLEGLNAPGCALESNDCAFAGPSANEHQQMAKSLQCSGRIMVLFRQLKRNTATEHIGWLRDQLHLRLAGIDPEFLLGIVGTTLVPVRYLALPTAGGQQYGSQLMISFWAWGNTSAEVMLNLARLVTNLTQALEYVLAQTAAA
jgi:hypothetical protein